MDTSFRDRTTDLLDAPEKRQTAADAADFFDGIFKGVIIHPAVAVAQIENKISGANPEQKSDLGTLKSGANTFGYMIGSALPVAGLALATKRIGGDGAAATTLRAAGIGFAHSAIFQPSDPSSQSFWQDRMRNGALSATTFAGMAGSAALLDKTGLFAVASGRTLSGHLAYGGLSGAAGGVINATADSLSKTGELPVKQDLLSRTVEYAAFGAAFSAIQYSYLKHRNPEPTSYTLEPNAAQRDKFHKYNTLSVWTDNQGDAFRVRLNTNYPLEMTKMGNGAWDTRVVHSHPGDYFIRNTLATYKDSNFRALDSGSLLLEANTFKILINPKEGKFVTKYMDKDGIAAASNMYGRYVGTIYDSRGRLTQVKEHLPFEQMPPNMDYLKSYGNSSATHIGYSREGVIDSISFSGKNFLRLQLNKNGDYDIVRSGQVVSKFEGKIGMAWTEKAGEVLVFQPNSVRAPFAIPADRLTLVKGNENKKHLQSYLEANPSNSPQREKFLNQLIIDGQSPDINRFVTVTRFSRNR